MARGNPTQDGVPATAHGFHTTHWTVVLAARNKDGAGAHEALSALYSTYWHPIYFTRPGIDIWPAFTPISSHGKTCIGPWIGRIIR